jgi:uncharacterized protein (UPF0333 family)
MIDKDALEILVTFLIILLIIVTCGAISVYHEVIRSERGKAIATTYAEAAKAIAETIMEDSHD